MKDRARFEARKDALRDKVIIEAIRFVLPKLEAEAALIGGLAVAYHVNPPVTVDIDFIVKSKWKELYERLKPVFRPLGWRVTMFGFPLRRWKPGTPLNGIRLMLEEPHMLVFDLLAAGADSYLKAVVDRAVQAEISATPDSEKLKLKIARPEDLVVLKILSGREKDIDDTEELTYALGEKFDEQYVFKTLDSLGWKIF